ncbi:MAG: hypothetical protein O3B21_06090 [Proteobacteria bacterium]|nr:hypothetical protein [Pseudomonadota bacterium]MDA1356759.1 hypothetical protein [Pseudomonadota bacterium]
MLTIILLAVVSCAEGPIAEPGSRADRVFAMANEGDSTAQTALGLLYERGLGVPHDPALALTWYRRAADQGDALAEFHIGSLYERGLGVENDYSEAAAWYQRASDKGNESAQAALAYLYDRGLGVERDFGEAEALYSQASASWAESDTYPAESTFATGGEGPALASPNIVSATVGDQRPEFTAGREGAPTIEIDLAALDDVPERAAAATVFDGPEPIAGRGENFPLATGSRTTPERTRDSESGASPGKVQSGAVDAEASRLPLPPGPKPVQPTILPSAEQLPAAEAKPVSENAEEGLLIVAQPEPERVTLSVKELLREESGAVKVIEPSVPEKKSPVPEAPVPQPEPPPKSAPIPVAESPAPMKEAEESVASKQAAEIQLGKAEEKLIASLEAELDDEAAAFESGRGAVADQVDQVDQVDDAVEAALEPLPPAPEIFMISLATFETRALAEAEWAKISKTHAGLVGRLPHEFQLVDMGDDGQFFELIVGPLKSSVQSRSLCGALRAHDHVCRTIDK